MPSREEIREGIQDIIIDLPDNDSYSNAGKRIMEYLHSQGVVIKVGKDQLALDRTYVMVAVDPLIKE